VPPASGNIFTNIALVAVGGAAGSVARYGLNIAAEKTIGPKFPAGTLAANLLGCLVIGAFLFFIADRAQPSPQVRLLAITGFLGGLTTFSSFGSETIQLFLAGTPGRAIANIAANVICGLSAVWLGYTLAKAAA